MKLHTHMQRIAAISAAVAVLVFGLGLKAYSQPLPGGTLDPLTIPKFVTNLAIPPVMPRTPHADPDIDYYEIAVRQFRQRMLPFGFPRTTVWGYGPIINPLGFHTPSFTFEATADRPVRVKWINDLKRPNGRFLPHLLPVDQTLHWANPPGGIAGRDSRGTDPAPYTGPVPMVAHLHGAHVGPESDGYPEAWYLPAARNIPAGYATQGTHFDQFDRTNTEPGTAVFQYPNDQAAATLWYHDHALGMTRLNVYAGPVGFYLIRGGNSDLEQGLPGPAPAPGDPLSMRHRYYEIPIAIQDKSFNADGSLFYPDNRAFFEGLDPGQLQIPFIPEEVVYPDLTSTGVSDISPIWNPEFFGNTMVVNGNTWPSLTVEKRRYRLRLLNGCDSRFLILRLVKGDPAARPAVSALPIWQIGADGGFLPAPVQLDTILMGPAERADIIVDFSGMDVGSEVYLINEGPDEPFGGGVPGVDFAYADPATTGQVMKFVVRARRGQDKSIDPAFLALPAFVPLGPVDNTRRVSLNEEDSQTIFVSEDADGNIVLDLAGEPFGPSAAKLGTVMLQPGQMPMGMPMMWEHAVTENPMVNTTEVWEIYNFTMDAHPIHLHQVQFEVLDREVWDPDMGNPDDAFIQPWETGFKDTVIVYPGQLTRIKARFDIPGLFVWHCHILSHEDNEMMRPFFVESSE